jgi:hypothetical protein
VLCLRTRCSELFAKRILERFPSSGRFAHHSSKLQRAAPTLAEQRRSLFAEWADEAFLGDVGDQDAMLEEAAGR